MLQNKKPPRRRLKIPIIIIVAGIKKQRMGGFFSLPQTGRAR